MRFDMTSTNGSDDRLVVASNRSIRYSTSADMRQSDEIWNLHKFEDEIDIAGLFLF